MPLGAEMKVARTWRTRIGLATLAATAGVGMLVAGPVARPALAEDIIVAILLAVLAGSVAPLGAAFHGVDLRLDRTVPSPPRR
jgi:hypothetical protein